ncbi:MAG TPA: hypothetical protein VL997_02170 [Dyella sp.]|nr:hypothetical protein [Dyella sp.]
MTSSASKKRTVEGVLKPFADFSVPIGKGEELAEQGDGSFKRRKLSAPPTHPQIQAKAKTFGKEMGDRFMKLDKSAQKESTRQMMELADDLEKQNADLLPKRHKEKVEKLVTGGVTGEKFRAIEKSLDEATQSKTTEAMNSGFAGSIKSHKEGQKFQVQLVRAQSSLRMRTEDVVAPVKEKSSKKTLGQQHPTRRDIPRVERGFSSHSHADRERSHTSISEGQRRAKSSKGVVEPFVHAMVTSGSMTLDRMSLPLTASNVSGDMFSTKARKAQMQKRETFKGMVNTAAKKVNIKIDTSTQKTTDPKKFSKEPTSPKRL